MVKYWWVQWQTTLLHSKQTSMNLYPAANHPTGNLPTRTFRLNHAISGMSVWLQILVLTEFLRAQRQPVEDARVDGSSIGGIRLAGVVTDAQNAQLQWQQIVTRSLPGSAQSMIKRMLYSAPLNHAKALWSDFSPRIRSCVNHAAFVAFGLAERNKLKRWSSDAQGLGYGSTDPAVSNTDT